MMPQFRIILLLLFYQHQSKGDSTDDWPGPTEPSHVIVNGMKDKFVDSVFQRKLVKGKWRYQSLTEDNSTGYCGYCKEQPKNQVDTYIIKNGANGHLILAHETKGEIETFSDPSLTISPVAGKVKLDSNDSSQSSYSGIYSVTRLLYNGFPQYEKDGGGTRLYVNIYNNWVLGSIGHKDRLVMSKVIIDLNQPTPTSPSNWPEWNKIQDKEGVLVMTLNSGTQLSSSSGKQPHCIIEGGNVFRLTSEGSYKIPGSFKDTDYFTRNAGGSWYQNSFSEYDHFEDTIYRTIESSTVIPRLGWGSKQKRYAPGNELSIIATPCTITLASNILDQLLPPSQNDFAGTYHIEHWSLLNDHPVYTKDDNKTSLYVNMFQEWVFGYLKIDTDTWPHPFEDDVLLLHNSPSPPLSWPEWSNSGTELDPVLTPQQGSQIPSLCFRSSPGDRRACKDEESQSSAGLISGIIVLVLALIVGVVVGVFLYRKPEARNKVVSMIQSACGRVKEESTVIFKRLQES